MQLSFPIRFDKQERRGRAGSGPNKLVGKQARSDASSSSAHLTSPGRSHLHPFLGLALYGPAR